MCIDLILLYGECSDEVLHRSEDSQTHSGDRGSEVSHNRVLLRAGRNELISLENELIITADLGIHGAIIQAEVLRDELQVIGRIIEIITDITRDGETVVVFKSQRRILRGLLHDDLCSSLEVADVVRGLVVLERIFNRSQLRLDNDQTLRDEL